MELFYPLVILVLFILSVFDLIIGLINDAVNFLNSAIGSKASSIRNIIITSSLGIVLGIFLSSDMMEITRKEIFNPSYFYFSDIILIFLSVMISDIILLNIFNNVGLPTSTTVSMVFCLLGSSFSIAILKIIFNNESFYYIFRYIKINKIINISIGMLISIIISFISGSIIHYFIRFLFTFESKNRFKYIDYIWASIALSSMTYFLIVNSIYTVYYESVTKYNYFFIKVFFELMNKHIIIFLFLLFLIWIIIAKIIIFLKYNILKFVVLYGTFSLSMAFSSNDLVNFIGIPVAGVQSYNIWMKEGYPNADTFKMSELIQHNKVKIPHLILILSGIIMILTLWFTKKINTLNRSIELNLSRQSMGKCKEKFTSKSISRAIVKLYICIGNIFFKYFPKKILLKIEDRFKIKNKNMNIAFDLVRASSNLTISSILISIATVNKLPLSTTFVTFMVSMGTSLSDRAWNRETAVYRVSGVLNVIRGWYFTAIIGFSISGVISVFLYFFKGFALLLLLILVIYFVYRNYLVNNKKK